jgi:hypothetical protein
MFDAPCWAAFHIRAEKGDLKVILRKKSPRRPEVDGGLDS